MINRKICDILFSFIVFSLIFNTIPQIIRLNFIGGAFARQLAFYPVLIGLIYTGYCQWKYGNVLIHFRVYRRFIEAYMIVSLVSLFWGVYIYPYYEEVINGPTQQIDKLLHVLNWLQIHQIYIDEQKLVVFWMIARMVKSIFGEVLYGFTVAYMVFCWYANREKDLISVLKKGIFVSLCVVFIYSGIEIAYLNGCDWSKEILKVINPYLYDVKGRHNWWPPLLWPNQLRSVFPEPSNFSMWAAFVIPFFICAFFKNNKQVLISSGCCLFLLFGMVFLTNSRTGVALLIGEIALLGAYVLWSRIRLFRVKFFLLLGILFVAFGMAALNDNIFQRTEGKVIQTYFEENVLSLGSQTQRSNRTRYGGIIADINIGMKHPLLGVGKGLASAYRAENYPEFALLATEVQMWLRDQKEQGILKEGLPGGSEYSARFAESGISGLALFLFPAIYLAIELLKKFYTNHKNIESVCLFIALCGALASGINGALNITYCYWLILGIGYVFINKRCVN